jgi:hypothetical protein
MITIFVEFRHFLAKNIAVFIKTNVMINCPGGVVKW